MDSILSQLHAVQAIRSVGRYRADRVRWINVLDRCFFSKAFKVSSRYVTNVLSDLGPSSITTDVDLLRYSQQLFASTFRYHNHCVLLLFDSLSEKRQDTIGSFEDNRNFWYEDQVDIARAKRRKCSQEALNN